MMTEIVKVEVKQEEEEVHTFIAENGFDSSDVYSTIKQEHAESTIVADPLNVTCNQKDVDIQNESSSNFLMCGRVSLAFV
ncbi:hypothetical protein PPYR_03539 [Photinus pyralis]|uniref:Uncharacterized protein n=1 Tax=Photinus pyralis TaxID=7054 RepID=A0A5N4A389_PHOPY|nr:hypothetical protein PPYR_03539 [Photinus pyralis]